MDPPPASESPINRRATNTGTRQPPPQQPTGTIAGDVPLQLRDRRREKPLLSCTFCRSRKVRCDRQFPCTTCTSRGIGPSCTYRMGVARKSKVSVGDRIQQLETLVRSLAQQQQTSQTSAVQSDGLATDPAYSFQATPDASLASVAPLEASSLVSVDEDSLMPALRRVSLPQGKDHAVSPAPSEHGSMRLHSHGTNYVGSVHWAAVLDSISELRDHYEEEEEARMLGTNDHMLHQIGGPRLLYEPVLATKADLIASIPTRPVVDRMVARYFNSRGVVPEVIHSGRFLQEYERFWLEPAAASYIWIGLLFSVMCLSTQYQQWIEDSADPETAVRVQLYREQTVNCLVLGQYTRGGDYVLETIINYLVSETFLSQDADVGIWLVQGMLVQLALSQGYHRDPRNFSNISPFAGEMRRRVWAVVVQLDLRLSGQMALPRLLKFQQYDTAEPRNLLDTDFNEDTAELPPSRPETEITPVLYTLAKNRIDKMNGLVNDLVNDTQEHRYREIMELNRRLEKVGDSLPPVFKWQPLSQSFMVQPEIVMHRVLLQLSIQRTVIWLHRKYLAPSYTQAHYASSRSVCVQAAIKILEFQKIVEEETQRDGLLYPVRWMFMSSRLQAVFLLGISILCYYVQVVKSSPDVFLEDTGSRIHTLLCDTYPLWLRLSTVSRDAQRVVEHLRTLLGLTGVQEGITRLASFPIVTSSLFTTSQDAAESLDQFNWNTVYEECIADFPLAAAFGAELMCTNAPGSSSATNVSMAGLLSTNNADLDGWMDSDKANEFYPERPCLR